MTELTGRTIEYEYDGGDRYQVSFGIGTATWEVLSGAPAGESRTETSHTREVADNVFFVTWLEATNEIVSFVANLNTREITCSYTFDGEQHFWLGVIHSVP